MSVSQPAAARRRPVRKQMPFGDLLMGFCVLILGLALLCRVPDTTLRFALLVTWMAGAGVVLATKTDFSWPR